MEDEEPESPPMTRRQWLVMIAAIGGAVATMMILSPRMDRAVGSLFPNPALGHYIGLALNVALSVAVYTAVMRGFWGPRP